MLKRLTTAFLVLSGTVFLSATTIELGGSATNIFWSGDRVADASGFLFDGKQLFWQVQGAISQELSDGIQFIGGIVEDPVLKRRLYAQLSFALDNLSIQFSPFLGVLNTTQKWFNPGLEAAVQYTFPGLGFIKGGFLTSFAPLSKPGDYYLASEFASMGLSLENGIISLSVDDKSSITRKSTSLDVEDSLTKYLLDTELFVKNFPLRPALILGFQTTGRSYVAATQNDTLLYSVLMGGRLVVDFGTQFSFYAEGIGSLFNLGGLDTVLGVSDASVLYQVQSGIRIHF